MKKLIDYNEILKFYEGKKIFITGNTGFKGAWLTRILLQAGALVIGYALEPEGEYSLYSLINLKESKNLIQHYDDVRDLEKMKQVFDSFRPEIVFHLAAQPIVRESYIHPVETYSVNVMGTVNVCECIRLSGSLVKSFVNVTTDKVYRNNEWEWGYREIDILDGHDPYSNSKSCSELVTHSYQRSFLNEQGVSASTVRAGNVVGGGDFGKDRIIPDCFFASIRASRSGLSEAVVDVRNPFSIRPYEHVLEVLFTYLLIAKAQYEDACFASCYNIGPDDSNYVSTGELVNLYADEWNDLIRNKDGRISFKWRDISSRQTFAPHEANILKLDCSKIKNTFGWQPRWHIEETIRQTVAFHYVLLNCLERGKETQSKLIKVEMDREIKEYCAG